MTGKVVAFDANRGVGELEADGRRYPFHCTAIADGTRKIDVGAEVTFVVAPGAGGHWEANQIQRQE